MRLIPNTKQPADSLRGTTFTSVPGHSGVSVQTTTPASHQASGETSKADQVASDFESLFVDLMLKSMRKTAVGENQSNAMDIYTSMLDSEYSKSMVQSRSLGIKGLILDWLNRNQHSLAESLEPQGVSLDTRVQPSDVRNGERKFDPEQAKARVASDFYALQARMSIK